MDPATQRNDTPPRQACCGGHAAATPGQAKDPVCGMTVDSGKTAHRAEHAGKPYVFCSAGCRGKFLADPDRYLVPQPARAAPAPAGTPYTCPMHPEVRHDGPGTCPFCGMALEPVAMTVEIPPNPELRDMTRRLGFGLVLALPLLLLDMSRHFGAPLPQAPADWTEWLLATPVVLWAGWPLLVRGMASVAQRNLNMFSLIALGTGAAYLYSLAALLAPQLIPAGFRAMGGRPSLYFEPAAMIVVLVLLGQVLELRAREATGGALRALLKLAPATAWTIAPGRPDREIPVAEVVVGDCLRIRPGSRIPVDGCVTEGRSAVDEAMVTGEALPVAKAAGARLIGGTLNGAGALVMRAEAVGSETMLARIVAMVAEAQRSRAPIQRLADRVARVFVPAVCAAALLAFVAWAAFGPAPALSYGLVAAVSVLIIACPCALGLATPMSIGVGVGMGAGAGILVRSAEALERFEKVDTLLVDKTGTLTEGRAKITAVKPAPGFEAAEVVALAASLERSSEHPLAAAILAAAQERGLVPEGAADFASHTGKGVTGRVGGRGVALGNAALMTELGVGLGALAAEAEALRREEATALFLAVDGRLAAVIAIADPIKSTTPQALAQLRAEGLRIVMLTGDDSATAAAVALKLGLTERHGDLLPEDKHRLVREFRAEGRIVAMAGDGVNDAPALAAADVGIAMGTGTEVALQSAGITLVKGDLLGLVRARRLSRLTMRNIRQNLVFAFAYNGIGIPVAAGVLYPAFGISLSPAVAALAMALSSVSVIGNALRLRGMRL